MDKTVPGAVPEGIVLRYGALYGPGASDVLLDVVRKRQMPVIGGGTGIWSFIEITDAAAATLAAVERGAPGVCNVVDSDPAPVAQWLPYLAEVAGARPPLRVPAWLGRLLAGEFVVAQMTSCTIGASSDLASLPEPHPSREPPPELRDLIRVAPSCRRRGGKDSTQHGHLRVTPIPSGVRSVQIHGPTPKDGTWA